MLDQRGRQVPRGLRHAFVSLPSAHDVPFEAIASLADGIGIVDPFATSGGS